MLNQPHSPAQSHPFISLQNILLYYPAHVNPNLYPLTQFKKKKIKLERAERKKKEA